MITILRFPFVCVSYQIRISDLSLPLRVFPSVLRGCTSHRATHFGKPAGFPIPVPNPIPFAVHNSHGSQAHVDASLFSLAMCLCLYCILPLVLMVSSKRPRHNENTLFSFVDQSTPTTKCPRIKAEPVTLAEIKNLQQERVQKDQAAAEVRVQAELKA